MSLARWHAWDLLVGVMSGSTLAYLLAVLIGLLLPSWPFNGFFTSLALVSLALQWPAWEIVDPDRAASLRRGSQAGAAVVLGLWLFYFLA